MFTVLLLLAALAVGLVLYLRRKASPHQVGVLRGTGRYEFDIVGESKYQDSLERICGGRTDESAEEYVQAVLVLEDSNAYDNQAVRVDIRGLTVGYLARKDARSYRAQLAKMGHASLVCTCNAVIVGGWRRSQKDQGHFGVKLDLPVT